MTEQPMTDGGKGALRAAIGLVVRGYLDDDQIEDIATAVVRLGYRPPTEYVHECGDGEIRCDHCHQAHNGTHREDDETEGTGS